ncbi:TetR/AcrR family transcriptional regulator [Actinokineospora enzanensis]|uniref:TetR/AcrR family transcriptional regulator n=1 Tax=Actinokineospora enzanensis TaxID=155975 RepID=UPI0003720DAD|nr:TetR/AcrR family transcriptional regulator [Actinokineospora enzanensis]
MGDGLRARKKARTRDAIAAAATALFLERGFDAVSVAEVAATADVSKMTVFNYFPTKEDLVMHQIDDADAAARTVRGRTSGESPVAALRRGFLADLAARDPGSGLSADEHFLAFRRMVVSTPGLRLRLGDLQLRAAARLAEAFAEVLGGAELTARVAASQVIAVRQELVQYNFDRVSAGRTPDEVYPEAVAAAEQGFDLLERGLGAVFA